MLKKKNGNFQLGYELAGLYRIFPFFEAGAGMRLNNVNAEVNKLRNTLGGGMQPLAASISRTWIDPIIIARFAHELNNKWLFIVRGDLGDLGRLRGLISLSAFIE